MCRIQWNIIFKSEKSGRRQMKYGYENKATWMGTFYFQKCIIIAVIYFLLNMCVCYWFSTFFALRVSAYHRSLCENILFEDNLYFSHIEHYTFITKYRSYNIRYRLRPMSWVRHRLWLNSMCCKHANETRTKQNAWSLKCVGCAEIDSGKERHSKTRNRSANWTHCQQYLRSFQTHTHKVKRNCFVVWNNISTSYNSMLFIIKKHGEKIEQSVLMWVYVWVNIHLVCI